MRQTKTRSRDEQEAEKLHREAMGLSEEAFLAEKRDGNRKAASQLTQVAFLKEKQAALKLADRADLKRMRAQQTESRRARIGLTAGYRSGWRVRGLTVIETKKGEHGWVNREARERLARLEAASPL